MTVRVFHPQPAVGTTVELSADESHYLVRVRRARTGDQVELLDGTHAYAGIVTGNDPKTASVEVHRRLEPAAVVPITLGLGLPDPKATLEAITLACEVGVSEIDLVRCEHSHHASPSAERIDRVIMAAQRQCGRPRAPVVTPPVPLAQWLARVDPRRGFVALPSEDWEPAPVPTELDSTGARVLVGPEGGLSPAEVDVAISAGLQRLSLGPWVLRSPTAAALAVGRLLQPS